MSQPPLDELQWKSPEWIQSFGLRTDNVLDYFSQSPFFDKTSNNHVVKMQQQFSQQMPPAPQTARPKAAPSAERQAIWDRYPAYALLEQELAKLKGIEYVLAHVREPDFWVVRKQRRAGDRVTALNDYYIIGANVYQAPTAYSVVQNRLLSTGFHLSAALGAIQRLARFQPGQGAAFVPVEQNSVQPASGTTASSATAPALTAALDGATAGYSDVLTPEMMDRLMLQSLKSTPLYL
ncbi:AAL055Cp [Eremothecium gossypii ATCC 10895]|uniref:Mediator of RNA polymerase II transcription subunit 6 n=1 Tax=Eremothecium gossypii (strain ATCC 10895 / CBS 109.51 / FGSC 9923 / NRRL Y-1056) TaxID=284811 RepID=MED6_EREGS|nr:AAL055Cp [Eremothecium gossypii ATCC 10895]Q75EY3.1 RecName: Full=Mediator of RNA polymerase II transcription subunit 6; AltName: Full=Mediator complex subunit 6 [Eremothecium gossypii ATCC 10895]AAS50311.1 AAL055Cp [Eremothecium gossypii ATCC 10895]AEY94597.1 FAAL055Cp [Eremothecium gossypii FDAG1]